MEELRSNGGISPGGNPANIPQELSPSRRETAPAQQDFSRFLEDFRSGREPQTTQWIRLASLVASQSFSCDIVVRALRPNEKNASGKTPLDRLGESLARKIGARYAPGRLKREGASYIFDASSLKPDVRALIVGDRETPPDAFAQIVGAITNACPGATARSFSLEWLEEHFRATPFDERYFLTSASPLSVLSKESNPHRSRTEQFLMPAEHVFTPAQPNTPGLRLLEPVDPSSRSGGSVESVPAARTAEEPSVAADPPGDPQAPVEPSAPIAVTPPPAPAAAARPKRGAPPRRTPESLKLKKPATASVVTAVALIAILVIGLGFVVFARLFAPKEETGYGQAFIPEPTLAPPEIPSAVAAVAPPAVVAEREKGPRGIVTVPSAGLRSGPSLEAKGMPVTLKNNERVTILKRRVSSAGPDWIQVETRGGKVGWVWASVVREIRR